MWCQALLDGALNASNWKGEYQYCFSQSDPFVALSNSGDSKTFCLSYVRKLSVGREGSEWGFGVLLRLTDLILYLFYQ